MSLWQRRRAAWPALGALVLILCGLAAGWSPSVDAARAGDVPAAPAQATVTPGHIIVRGRIYYTDRLGDRNHPAAGVRVEIWDLDAGFPATSQKLGETITDSDGRFESDEIANADPDGPAGGTDGTQDVFLKLFTDNGRIRLLRPGTRQEFGWNSYEIDERDGLRRNVADGVVGFPTQYLLENTRDVEALWTYANMAEAWFYMAEQTGRDPGDLLAYWSPDSRDGPRYDPEGRALYFRDEDAGYTPLVIQHAAYALLHNLYGTLPDAWVPCLDSVPADLRTATDPACALLHGLAGFLPSAVTGDPIFETPATRAVDLDAAAAGTPGWDDGDTVPGRIAGTFWDLHENDPTAETYDLFNATFGDVWAVFDGQRPETMADWWAGWLALGQDGCGALGSLFQNTIDYNTAPLITPVPDVIIDEDDTATLDLTNYVHDAECDDEGLEFTLLEAGPPEAGITLGAAGVVSIAPVPDWYGEANVRVAVSDGLKGAELSFRVIVNGVNDCPTIDPRVPDPPPATFGQPIALELAAYGHDVEDDAAQLAWDAQLEPGVEANVTVVGRGTTQLVFVLDTRVAAGYSARVTLIVRDLDGCTATQNIVLYWSDRRNNPPSVLPDRFTAEYFAPINTTIEVDLTGVASDQEDPPEALDWFVTNGDVLNAQVSKFGRQRIDFEPEVGFVGSNVAELEVQDSGGARATAAITLTWRSSDEVSNLPPRILRQKLLPKRVGIDAQACYELTDKAVDPDHAQTSLRWFADEFDDTTLFVGTQGRRQLCFRARPGFEGCHTVRFTVRDPKDAEDSHYVSTCWRTIQVHLPMLMR